MSKGENPYQVVRCLGIARHESSKGLFIALLGTITVTEKPAKGNRFADKSAKHAVLRGTEPG